MDGEYEMNETCTVAAYLAVVMILAIMISAAAIRTNQKFKKMERDRRNMGTLPIPQEESVSDTTAEAKTESRSDAEQKTGNWGESEQKWETEDRRRNPREEGRQGCLHRSKDQLSDGQTDY